ncbi:MAG: ABC transporter ATP-binding protein [Xanthomonadaceae bacterium]|nr:ABC transporter ATP-binding protein [Xanthomonadaceae bacterium]
MSLLAVDMLRVRHRAVTVVDGVSFTLAAGESLGLVGESGSGKSQTALALLGLLPATAAVGGSIRFDGRELIGAGRAQLDRLRGSRVAMVFQDPMSSLNPYLRIGVQMAEVLEQHRGSARSAAFREAARMLDAVRIANPARCLTQYPHELSGGMRQRVLIAMALLAQPELLIADEPTTALDVTVQAEVLAVLDDLRRDLRLALLLITHDLGVVSGHCERMAVMYAGRIVESGPTVAVLALPAHPYTAALLASRPHLVGPRPGRLPSIAGQPPDPARRPPGCAFAPRCRQVVAACLELAPILRSESGRACACHVVEGASGSAGHATDRNFA